MAVKTRLINDEKNQSWDGLDDLDAVFLEKMKEQGMDESLIEAFAGLAAESNANHKAMNGEGDDE